MTMISMIPNDSAPSMPISSTSTLDTLTRLPQSLTQALWWANDGRCERCHRPMDRRFARSAPDYPDQTSLDRWALVCPLCHAGYTPLAWDPQRMPPALIDTVGAHLANPMATSAGIAEWIIRVFDTQGILVPFRHWNYPMSFPVITLWHPGIGHLQIDPRVDPVTAPAIRILDWRFPHHAFPADPWLRPPARTRSKECRTPD